MSYWHQRIQDLVKDFNRRMSSIEQEFITIKKRLNAVEYEVKSLKGYLGRKEPVEH